MDLLQTFGADVWRAKIVYEVKRGIRSLDGKLLQGAELQLEAEAEADAHRLEQESSRVERVSTEQLLLTLSQRVSAGRT